MERRNIHKNEGSILIGVLIVMLMIAAISIAVVYRTIQDISIATGSRQGISAYQESDKNAEEVLDNIKKLDSKTNGDIPENISASDVCGSMECLNDDGASAEVVADIVNVKGIGSSQSVKRAVSVPVPVRATNPIGILSAENGAMDEGYPNSCDALLKWEMGSASNVDSLEVRFNSESSSLKNSKKWFRPEDGYEIDDYSSLEQLIGNENFDYGKTYYFAIKAKNENNLSLDSLYFPSENGTSFTAPEESCSGSSVLGCLPVAPSHSHALTTMYACCGGTECYECDTGYTRSGNNCVE